MTRSRGWKDRAGAEGGSEGATCTVRVRMADGCNGLPVSLLIGRGARGRAAFLLRSGAPEPSPQTDYAPCYLHIAPECTVCQLGSLRADKRN